MTARFELTVEAKVEQLARIGEFIADAMRAFGLNARESFEVQLAVDEACANIMHYAYSEAGGTIELSCERRNGEVRVVIRDRGKPFDPTTVPPPKLDADVEDRPVGGLGIYFMRRVMDGIAYEYRDGQNVLTMVKLKSSQ
jgi:serine/threonine-protein kinase RsbW